MPQRKLLDRVRDAIRLKHYSIRTEETYVASIKRYILFHQKRHPQKMGSTEIEAFLTHLAVDRNVAASTQNQALNALVFLYREVLRKDLHGPIEPVRAKRPKRLPAVLTKFQSLTQSPKGSSAQERSACICVNLRPISPRAAFPGSSSHSFDWILDRPSSYS